MAGRRLRASAFGLVVLLVASTWLGALTAYDGDSIALGEQSEPSLVGVGDTVDLTLTTLPNSNFDLDLPADEPLVSAELNFTPKVLPSQSGFVWDSASDWNHPDALTNGSSVSSTTGGLTGSSPGILWDFNTNSQGWTFSNSYTGRVTTPACGYNGTSGGSLRTYAGSTYGTSPVLNLAGGSTSPSMRGSTKVEVGVEKHQTAAKTFSFNTGLPREVGPPSEPSAEAAAKPPTFSS